MSNNLYITGTEARSGKSVVSLGVMEMLLRNIERVGFFRPIINVEPESGAMDNDINLIRTHFNLPMPYDHMYGYTTSEVNKLISAGKEEEVIEEELKLMEEGKIIGDLYKGFGMKMDVEIDDNAGSYKGVKIGAAKVIFKTGGGDDMQTQMFAKMFGDGIDYCWAFEKGNCLYTLGSDADKTIRELIDQVRAGGPKKINAEMKTATEAIDDSKKADAIGTLNYARAIGMALGFMPLPEGTDTSKLKVQSSSNIAFAGRTKERSEAVPVARRIVVNMRCRSSVAALLDPAYVNQPS